MKNENNLKQTGGDNSTNFQGNITINHTCGISYADAKMLVTDLFNSNFLKLKNEAAALAKDRASEIIDRFLARLFNEKTTMINEMREPGLQAAIFEAQKSYVISGNRDNVEILASLLIERIEKAEYSSFHITIDEAIAKVAKLTPNQLQLLLLLFVLFNKDNKFDNMDSFKDYLDKELFPLAKNYIIPDEVIRHLEHLGCIRPSSVDITTFSQLLLLKYRTLFSKGFTKEDYNKSMEDGAYLFESYLIPCHYNPERLQLGMNIPDVYLSIRGDNRIIETAQENINRLIIRSQFSTEEITSFVIQINPEKAIYIDQLFSDSISRYELTPIGVALAVAQYNNFYERKLEIKDYISTGDIFELERP